MPGDKSITHRALILAALSRGESRLEGALASRDIAATGSTLSELGVAVSALDAPVVRVRGPGGFSAPLASLDCRNSGTTARLLCGALAAHRFISRLTGDASLSRRPMRRVTEPLAAMGAAFPAGSDTLPLTIQGAELRSISWTPPVASAQVKSAVLLAAMAARVPVEIREPVQTRDHTERLLRRLGCTISEAEGTIRFSPGGELIAFDLEIPGDLSSAAFLAGAAAIGGEGEVRLSRVGLNPTRTGFLDVLARMGGAWQTDALVDVDGEPAGDLIVGAASLRATTVEPAEVPRLIDEVPLLAVLAARAEGTTRFRGMAELRHKESDRLKLLAENLRAVGVAAEVFGDALHVTGTDRPPSGRVETAGDHRLAMAFAVLATVPGAMIALDDPHCADVSYPGFAAALRLAARRVAAGRAAS